MKNNKQKLYEIINKYVSVVYEEKELQDCMDLINDLGFDSISLMQVVLELESEFNIIFDSDLKYEEISTIENLKKYVEKKIQEEGNNG